MAENVVCKTDGCQQVVFVITAGGEVYPIGFRVRVERDGRVAVDCPACKVRNRHVVAKLAA